MANYQLDYTGEQVNRAIGNALSGSGGTQLYLHTITGITIVNAKGNTLISSTDKIYAQSTISNSLADDGNALTLFKNGSTNFFNYRTSNYNYYIVSLKETYITLIDNTAGVILCGLTMQIGTISDTVTAL